MCGGASGMREYAAHVEQATARRGAETMDPDWSDLKVLLAVARQGSVAGAARSLEVDHSTVSRRLTALEEVFGAKLLIRGGREFSWTAEGRVVLAAAETVESAILDATRKIRTARLEAEGTVRVSVPPAFIPPLMPMLAAARARHPLLEIQLLGDFRRVDLARGEAEIAIRMSRPEEPDLVGRKAFECGWCAYASSAYLAEQGRPATVDELPRHQLVLYVESMHNIPPLCWMEAYRDAATRVTRVDNLDIVAGVLLTGSGIGLLPSFIAERHAGLVRVFPDPVVFNSGWIVYHNALRETTRVRAVIDALVDFFESERALFTGRRDVTSDLRA